MDIRRRYSINCHFCCCREDLGMRYNDPAFNTNVYLCVYKKEIDEKIFGLGSVGGACSTNLTSHAVIMGYDLNDIIVGTVRMIFNF